MKSLNLISSFVFNTLNKPYEGKKIIITLNDSINRCCTLIEKFYSNYFIALAYVSKNIKNLIFDKLALYQYFLNYYDIYIVH